MLAIPKSALFKHLCLSAYGNTFYAIWIRIADLHRGYGSRISAYGNAHLFDIFLLLQRYMDSCNCLLYVLLSIYMYFYLILLSPWTAILQIINR